MHVHLRSQVSGQSEKNRMNLTNRRKIIKVCILGITMTFILDIPFIIFHLLAFVKSTNRAGPNFNFDTKIEFVDS